MSETQLVTFWSAAGSPGKSTLSLAVATELVEAGKNVLLIDADTYAPAIDVLLGLNDHPAGLAAACRLVAQNRFDIEQLERLSVSFEIGGKTLSIMTGLSSASRWPEVTPEKLSELVQVASQQFEFVILDVAAEIQAQIRSVNSAVDRNSVSRWAIANSDLVVAVAGADPVGVARHLDAMSAVMELQPRGEVLTLVNRLRTSVLGLSAKQQITQTLAGLGQLQVAGFVPDDPAAADAALKASMPMAMSKRSSQARLAIALFTKTRILGEQTALDRRLFRPVAKLS